MRLAKFTSLILIAIAISGCTSKIKTTKLGPLKVQAYVAPKANHNKQTIQHPRKPPPPPPLVEAVKPPNYPDLTKPVTLSVYNAPLRQVLVTLAKQTDVNLVVSSDVGNPLVNANFVHTPLGKVLYAILKADGLYFSLHPHYIQISKMITKVFHINYVMSIRGGESTTEVTLSSGGSSTSGSSGTTSGTISVKSSELVDFWKNFETELKSILQDPLYKILQSEYARRKLENKIALLPYEAQYSKESQQQQLQMLTLRNAILKKALEEGNIGTTTLNSLIPSQKRITQQETAAGNQATGTTSSVAPSLIGSYTIDPQTGTIIVTTTPSVMKRVEAFISKIKKNLTREVLIDVQILEVDLNKTHKLGIDWSKFPGVIQFYSMPKLKSTINSIISSEASSSSGGATTSSSGIVSPISTSPFPSSAQGSLEVGVLATPTPTAAVQWSNEALINFLSTQGRVNTVSSPQLLTLNNQPAIVSVGVNDFYVTYEQSTTSSSSNLSTSTVTSKLNPLFIGVTLNITPEIAKNGKIILKIVEAVNKKIGEKTVPTGIPSAPTQTIPLVETRQTSTIVRTMSGQPVIISGLIQQTNSRTLKKVPLLGDIPLLGGLFRYRESTNTHSELVIIVTPYLKTNLQGLGYKHITR